MANEQNLIPANKRSKSEARANSRKGGIASGKARREKAEFKKLIEIALNEEYKEGMTNAEALVLSMLTKALEGDTKAFEILRDTAGQKPIDKIEVGVADSVAEQLQALDV